MAKRRKARRKTRRRTKTSQQKQGWVWGLFGLGVGLSVSAFIYLKDRQTTSATPPPQQPQAEAKAPTAAKPKPKPAETAGDDGTTFSFYDILPQFEVLVPEEDLSAQPARTVRAVDEPGSYILQAGSFSNLADADRRKAELALLDIESRFQKVTVDDKVYHRVRIGPVDDLNRLNELRGRLNRAGIDAMVIRVRE